MERAVLFDAMGTLFDVSPVEQRFGREAMPRLLHTAAATTLAGAFVPFPELVRMLLGPGALELFASLDPYPDASQALDLLEADGARAAILTNGSEENTRTLLERGGLAGRIEPVLSVEAVQAYKPAAAPYRHALGALGLPGDRVTLVGAHAWDVLGARQAGLGAVWVDRKGEPWPFPGSEEPRRASGLADAVRA